jgi:hypothetical protein
MTLALLRPSEAEVQRVMTDTGMDYIQAWRHIKQRLYLQKIVIEQRHRDVERIISSRSPR